MGESGDVEKIHWSDWEGKGKTEFHSACKKRGVTSPQTRRLLYNLLSEATYGVLSPDEAAEACAALIPLSDDIPSIILDVLNVLDAETLAEASADGRKKLEKVTRALEPITSRTLLLERIELESLGEFKMINKTFFSKFIKIKTKQYYKQNKFNLYREESEGFSKLMIELNRTTGNMPSRIVLQNIKSLIGCFNIDPTRVLDIMLNSFECSPNQVKFFGELIKSYLPDKKLLKEVVGFNFSWYRNAATPKSLHVLATNLIHQDILSLEEVYPWLTPDDKTIAKELEQKMKEEGSGNWRKATVVSVKDASETASSDQPAVELPPFENNQKLGLAEVLILTGDWAAFQKVCNQLGAGYLMQYPQISLALSSLIHYLIDPVYKKYSGLGSKILKTPLKKPELDYCKNTPAQVTTLLGLRDHVFPMLCTIGAALQHDPVLIFKVIRLAAAAVSEFKPGENTDPGPDSLYYDIITILDEVLLPTLSYLEANCCVAEAIWNVIKVYPLPFRHAIYTKWKDYTIRHQTEINRKMQGKANIKSCMKRVSKENVKQVGRLIGKLSHHSPAALFDYILIQIQMYDNLIGPVVDSLKYLNSLSYDVLGFCIVDSLRTNKKKPKYDGNSLAPWFQSTAAFCAAVFKKYSVELSGLLFYILDQLKANKSFDLIILKEILNKMAGIEASDELPDNQLEALAGGEILRNEAGYFIQQRNTKKSTTRLKDALVKYKIAAPLAISIAQERYNIVFHQMDIEHLKLIGKLYDECHDTLLQFSQFLAGTAMQESSLTLPSFSQLITDYHLELDVAFLFTRPIIIHQVAEECDKTKSKSDPPSYIDILCDKIQPLADTVRLLQPEKTWEDLSPEFITLFWSLTLYDIRLPTLAYQREMAKLKSQLSTTSGKKPGTSDPQSQSGNTKPKKEAERVQTLLEKMKEERAKQKGHISSVLDKLRKDKENWFVLRSQRPAKNEMITQFLQMCIFPRVMLSALDALYCAQFIDTLHTVQAPNFSTLLCYDRLFCDISVTVTACTENEANRYGRFLCAVLENVMRWHSSKEIYDKECANTPGFVTKFRGSNEFSEPNDNVHYENYRHVCHKWHYKITKSLINLLESKEYVQIRNAIIILIKILPHFPVITRLAQFIEKRVTKVIEEEKKNRQDLCILATSYCGQLVAKIPTMMKESEFHVIVAQANTTTNTAGAQPAPPAPQASDSQASNTANGAPPQEEKQEAQDAASETEADKPKAKKAKTSQDDPSEADEKGRPHHDKAPVKHAEQTEERKHKSPSPSTDDERMLDVCSDEYMPLRKDDGKHSSSSKSKEVKKRRVDRSDTTPEKKAKKSRKVRSSEKEEEREKSRKERKMTKKRDRGAEGSGSSGGSSTAAQPTGGSGKRSKEVERSTKSKTTEESEEKKRRYSKEKSPPSSSRSSSSRDKKYSSDRKSWR